MQARRDRSSASSLRLVLAGLALGLLTLPLPAQAQETLLPPGFFDSLPVAPGQQATIEADLLTYDAARGVVTASGTVVMTYEGYVLRAGQVSYDRRSGTVTADGNTRILNPDGTEFSGEHVRLTGEFKRAFIESLTIKLADGSLISADSADYARGVETILENGLYSPCGECIDSKGRRIGWKVRAKRMVYNRGEGIVDMEEPSLELLGTQVAWLPFLRIPDPTQPRLTGSRLPELDYSAGLGVTVTLPYFVAVGEDTDLIFTPRLMSRQGALFAAQAIHRIGTLGTIEARVAGVYQLDPKAFAGQPGDRDWRGAIQTSGRFEPVENWSAGWSYTAFTDPAFLPDYKLVSSKTLVNEAYATHLSDDWYADLRVQRFYLLGNVAPTEQDRQALAIPNVVVANVTDLPDDWGQVRMSLRVLGVARTLDHTANFGGVPYVFGYRENKAHATIEANWQNPVVVPGGLVVTPYLGLRADAAWYDGSSPLLAGPVSLLTATPIAALDVRWPLVATSGVSSFLFEPIAQLAYRGSGVTAPGITNDNALSFVFEDTNLFSYDRFSGTDRQETGLRANVGAHYAATFEDGSWIDLIAGQSYFLGGVNSAGTPDAAQVGLGGGLGMPTSYFLVGARAGIDNTFEAGAKAQIDTLTPRLALVAAGLRYNEGRFSAGLDYTYIPANPVIGVLADQHEVTLTAGIPIADYWKATATVGWDLAQNTWLEAGAGLYYDDGYLLFGAAGTFTGPTHTTPNGFTATATLKLKGPAGEFGFVR